MRKRRPPPPRAAQTLLRERYSRVAVSSVVLEGVAFGMVGSGPNGTGPREGLVIEAHGRSADYTPEGLLEPPPGFTRETCPEWWCGVMVPKKSLLRVRHAPVAGVRVHHHDVGPFAREMPAPGALLKLNHYPFDDADAVVRRGRFDLVANRRIAPGDADGVASFMSRVPDESARALAPLLRRCMLDANRGAPECGRYPVA